MIPNQSSILLPTFANMILRVSETPIAVNGETTRRRVKEKSPDWVNQSGLIISGNVLLSHNLEKHYHRGCSVSLPCSEWERVGPLRDNHQTWGLLEIGRIGLMRLIRFSPKPPASGDAVRCSFSAVFADNCTSDSFTSLAFCFR